MKELQKQLLGNSLAILVLGAFLAYGHYATTELTSFFVEARKSESKYIADIIRNNWGGITTISDVDKKNLLENLRPEMTGSDVEAMGLVARVLIYLIGVGFIIDRVIAIGKVLIARRRYNNRFESTP